MNCWITAYEPGFNFIDQLNKLEHTLLEQDQITRTSSEDYRQLFEDMGTGELNLNFQNISVEQFVSGEPFKECAINSNFPNEDAGTVKYGLLFSIYVVLAREHATINVEINNNFELLYQNQVIELSSFAERALSSMNDLEQKGIPREEIIFNLKVAENVKMGLVVDLQQQLRDLKVRKVNYGN